MAQLQLSVVGAGQIGKRHIELIMASNRCALHSIVDPTPESMALAKQLNATHYTSLNELLASTVYELPQGTIIASPNQLHSQQSLDCIRHGIATFIEKPIAVTAAQGESICELAKF
jgi:predicted dehydrogenase